MAQSPKLKARWSGITIRKMEETMLIPGAMPIDWIAARITSPVVCAAPVTPPSASPMRTIIAP